MAEKKRIRVPTFMDDPVVGRFISAIPFTCRFICPPLDLFSDHIVIDGDNLVFKRSKTSYQGDKTYYLKNIAKLLVRKRKTSCWKKDHTINLFGIAGTEIELNIVDINGAAHVLIPKFNLGLEGGRRTTGLGAIFI